MDFDKKRILALIGLIIVTCGVGYLIYSVFFKTSAPPEEQVVAEGEAPGRLGRSGPGEHVPGQGPTPLPEQFTAPIVLPTASTPSQGSPLEKVVAVTTVVTGPSAGVTLAGDGSSVQYYNSTEGLFYKTGLDGKAVPLSDQLFPQADNIAWAPNKGKASMEFPDGSKIIYDFDKQKQYTIPSHWTELAFSPDSQRIVGKTASPDPAARFLFTASTDGTGAVPVEPLGENGDKVIVDWSPNNQVLAFSRTGEALSGGADRQSVLLIGKNHENFRGMSIEGLGFEPSWSPTGDRVLYSAHSGASNLEPTLWVDGGNDDTVGAAKNYLGVNTWASKCTFQSNDEVLCAVPDPDKLTPGIGFAPQLATDTNDTIYKINIKTGLQVVIGKPEGNRTLSQMVVSKDGSYLYMKDAQTDEVIKMQLK